MMMMMKLILVAATLLASAASAYVVGPAKTSTTSFRQTTRLYENFGLGLGEDTYENQPKLLGGEAEYKQWVGKFNENAFVNRQYNVIRRVRELDLLKATVDQGILSKLEAQGVDLKTIEKLLPVLEKAGALSLAANNQQLLVNLLAPLLVEGAPLLLPVVAGALDAGPSAFYSAAAVCLGLEGILIVSGAEVPLIGLPADVLLGLLLVPLAVVTGGVGVALSSLAKK